MKLDPKKELKGQTKTSQAKVPNIGHRKPTPLNLQIQNKDTPSAMSKPMDSTAEEHSLFSSKKANRLRPHLE